MNIRKLIKRGLHTLAICSMMVMISGCSKEKGTAIKEEPMISPIITSEAGNPTPTPTPILMTPAPGVTLTPTPEPTPTAEPVVLMTKAEAEAKLKEKVDTSKYFYELAEDNLSIDGISYFRYVLYDNGVELQPYIIIDRTTGELSIYDNDGNIEAFTKFPLDKVESIDSNEDAEVTVDTALNILKKVKKEKLGLPNNLSHYTIIADEWTTIVNGESCYCFNVFEGSEEGQLVALYYVSTEGTAVYTFDEENGEFIRCDL